MASKELIRAAATKARSLASGERAQPPPQERTTRRIVIGDPQASLETFLGVLAFHDLLSSSGWLLPSVELTSVGDHFDWGRPEQRDSAATDGLALLSWLAAHDAKQVTLIAGNHDLGRVGELASFDDEQFLQAHAQALLAYRGGDPEASLEATFLADYPQLPSAELAARDFAAFAVAQRDLIIDLLLSGRLRLASAIADSALVCHAGITSSELRALEYSGDRHDANAVADVVNTRLARAIEGWQGNGRLRIESLHTAGDAHFGEGGGMLYHRPANPEVTGQAETYRGPGRRRYDPRTLPTGLTQVVGHISDAKCRSLLGGWASGEPGPGSLRHLVSDGQEVLYQVGPLPQLCGPRHKARLIFVDGGMSRVPREDYQVLEYESG